MRTALVTALALSLTLSPQVAGQEVQSGAALQPVPPGAPVPAQTLSAEEAEHQASITYDRTNRMTVDVRVNNGSAVPFLVDTGSERTVISDKLVSELGLPSAGPLKISGVAGTLSVPSARIAGLDFTNVRVPEFVAPVLDKRHMGADGLIGIDSLQDKAVLFDFDNHRMQIKRAKRRSVPTIVKDDEIIVTGSTREGRLIITRAEVEGIAVTVVIDSGSQYSIGNPALLARLQKRNKVRNPIPTILYSVTGQQLPAMVMKAKNVEIGKISLGDMPVAFADSPAFATLKLDKKPAMLLGMNTLRAFRQVEVDFTNKRVRFITPGGVLRASETRYALGCAARAQCGQVMPGS